MSNAQCVNRRMRVCDCELSECEQDLPASDVCGVRLCGNAISKKKKQGRRFEHATRVGWAFNISTRNH